MLRKNIILSLILVLVLSFVSCGEKAVIETASNPSDDAAKLLTVVKTTQFFTDEKVSQEESKRQER